MDHDLVIKAKLTTEYQLIPEGKEGFLVMDGETYITGFRLPKAVDAERKPLAITAELKGDVLEITLGKADLAGAKFPILINPPPSSGPMVRERPPMGRERPPMGREGPPREAPQ